MDCLQQSEFMQTIHNGRYPLFVNHMVELMADARSGNPLEKRARVQQELHGALFNTKSEPTCEAHGAQHAGGIVDEGK
jgi:hypothetical protein